MPNIYLTTAEVLEMHRQLVDEFGGAHGLRDPGALDAAIFRPQTGYYTDIIEEAAALMESLTNNHAFIDGNKRIGFAATDTFLHINGYQLEVDSLQGNKFITESLAKNEFRFAAIKPWISANLRLLDD